MNKSMVLNTVISATAGGVLGGIVTYLTVKKSIQARADADVADVKQRYMLLRKEGDILGTIAGEDGPDAEPTAEERQADLAEYVRQLREHDYHGSVAKVNPVGDNSVGNQLEDDALPVGNAFERATVETPASIGYERIEGQPYLITRLEYEEGNGYDKDTVIYYDGDDIMADTQNPTSPIEDIEKFFGRRHLDMFGVLSDDPVLVYIRNEAIATDYEVMLNKGYWTQSVMGIGAEELGLEDSKRPIRSMRNDE